MKTVTEDPYEFYKEGGWAFLQTGANGEGGSSDEESEAESVFDPVCQNFIHYKDLVLKSCLV